MTYGKHVNSGKTWDLWKKQKSLEVLYIQRINVRAFQVNGAMVLQYVSQAPATRSLFRALVGLLKVYTVPPGALRNSKDNILVVGGGGGYAHFQAFSLFLVAAKSTTFIVIFYSEGCQTNMRVLVNLVGSRRSFLKGQWNEITIYLILSVSLITEKTVDGRAHQQFSHKKLKILTRHCWHNTFLTNLIFFYLK